MKYTLGPSDHVYDTGSGAAADLPPPPVLANLAPLKLPQLCRPIWPRPIAGGGEVAYFHFESQKPVNRDVNSAAVLAGGCKCLSLWNNYDITPIFELHIIKLYKA